MKNSVELVRCLMRAAVLPEAGTVEAPLSRVAAAASARDWRLCESLLERNRLLAPSAEAVERSGLDHLIAEPLRERMHEQLERAVEANRARLSAYAELAQRLRERGVEPIVLKSAGLVALGAAGLGSPMNDVDAYVDASQRPVVEEVLAEQGYQCTNTLAHAADWLDPSGALRLDLHFHFGLFSHMRSDELAVDRDASWPGLGHVRVLEPNAMLVHLAIHLCEHRVDYGYQLRWLLDVGHVLRRWGADMRLDRIEQLLQYPIHRIWLLRTVAFFEAEIGLALPAAFADGAALVYPLTLDAALFSQRVYPWRLRTVGGWGMLARCVLGRVALEQRGFPRPSDAFAWLIERHRERRSYALVERALGPWQA